MPHTFELLRVTTALGQMVFLGPTVPPIGFSGTMGSGPHAHPVGGVQVEPADGALFYDDISYQVQMTARSPVQVTLGNRFLDIHWVSHGSLVVATLALNFRQIGWTELRLGQEGVRVRVLSRKLDYETDYRAMVQDLENQIRGLTARLISHIVNPMDVSESSRDLWSYWLALLEKLWKNLVFDVIQAWRTLPPHLVKHQQMMDVGRMKRPHLGDMRRYAEGKARVHTELRRWEDLTPERRYMIRLVSDVHGRLTRIQASDPKLLANVRFRAIWEESGRLAQQLARASGLEQVVGQPQIPMSPLAQSHPALSRVVRWHRLLRRGLFPNGDSYFVGPKNMSLLYEYWCYLSIVRMVVEESGGQLVVEPMASVHPRDIALGGGKGSAARVALDNGRSIDVVYQRLFRGPTVAQQPDHVVQLTGLGSVTVFDAKYRFELDGDDLLHYGGDVPIPPVATINSMHQYHDAIVVSHPPYQRLVDRAIVLFPLPKEYTEVWREHRFYQSIEAVGVGALPMVPGGTDQYLREEICRYLNRHDAR